GYSAVTEPVVFRPLRQSRAQMPLIASVGLSIVLQNFVFVTGAPGNLWMPIPLSGGFVLAESGGFSLYLNRQQGVILALTLLLVGVAWYLLARTPYGRAQRACSQDRRMAALLGVDVDRVTVTTFALGGALAGSGGVMVATYYGGVNITMGVMLGLKALTAAIVGGIGNFWGAVLGSFVVALLEALWGGYFFTAYKDTAVFALLILILVFRPQGLLGEA
ncbi:MAG: branched-chain amino acid ABC transporter permease, partial [Alphaproteobacteria bacterium]